MLAQELVLGETVVIEVQLSPVSAPLQMRAIVRYQDRLRIGLEFVGLSANQREVIRRWAQETKPETEIRSGPIVVMATRSVEAQGGNREAFSRRSPRS
jgi:hypothetical protein